MACTGSPAGINCIKHIYYGVNCAKGSVLRFFTAVRTGSPSYREQCAELPCDGGAVRRDGRTASRESGPPKLSVLQLNVLKFAFNICRAQRGSGSCCA